MSLKSLLMPLISRHLLSAQRLAAQRERTERKRRSSGEPHRVLYFHQACDPYSALAAQALPALAARYAIELQPHLVGPPPDSAAPERQRLVAYSRSDAALLAHRFNLQFDGQATQPSAQALANAQALLLGAAGQGRFTQCACSISASLWQAQAFSPMGFEPASAAAVAQAVAQGNALRERLGHYLGGMFFYGGEWYWGIDRLHQLERRLQALGAAHAGVQGCLFEPPANEAAPEAKSAAVIDFFASLRSPYTAIAVPLVYELARRTGAEVRLRPLLPMVMRGLPVPGIKRRYIAADAAREARLRGVPFGCINDPLGTPTERGMAVLALARTQGREEAFLRSFMQGVWAEGVDAGSQRGLRKLAERAGLAWPDCAAALDDDTWRSAAETNRRDMFSLGLWGVPSFRVGNFSTWGQDRLWAVEEAVRATARTAAT